MILHVAGVLLKVEERRGELESGGRGSVSTPEVCEVIMADLHQRHGADFEATLHDIQEMVRQLLIHVYINDIML